MPALNQLRHYENMNIMVYAKTLELFSEEIKIRGNFYAPSQTGVYPTLCICHGIPSGQLPEPGDGGYPELAERFCREGYAVETFSFRGRGRAVETSIFLAGRRTWLQSWISSGASHLSIAPASPCSVSARALRCQFASALAMPISQQ